MKVLLVNPPWETLEQHIYSTVGNVLPPLGLAYIAAVLRGNKIEVDILDALVLGMTWDDFRKAVRDRAPDIVGITAGTSMIKSAFMAADIVKEELPKSTVILGGPHPTVLPGESLKRKAVDIVMRGESEYTFLDFMKEMKKSKPNLSKVDGISYKKGKNTRHNKNRAPIMELDKLPLPARDLLPMKMYHATPGNHRREPATSIMSSRGCPFSCIYCAKPFGMRFRAHSPEYVIKEMEHVMRKYGVKEIIFFDDTFTFNKKRTEEICDTLIEKKWDLTWSCMARGDTVDYELAKKMKAAGCQYVGFGVESADPRILNNLKKGEKIEKIENAIRACRKAGILVRGFYIIGSPGDTPKTIKGNIEHAKRMKLDLAQFSIITPFPGTELFQWAEKNKLLLTKDWSLYDCSEPVMKLPNMSTDDLKYWYQRSFREFYGRPAFIVRQAFKIRSIQDFKRYAKTFFSLLKRWTGN